MVVSFCLATPDGDKRQLQVFFFFFARLLINTIMVRKSSDKSLKSTILLTDKQHWKYNRLTRGDKFSGVRRLFERQGRKEGHFSMCFGSQEVSLSCFNQPRGQFSVLFGSHEGTLAHVLVPRRTL